MATRDKYIIDLEVQEGKGLTSMEAMVRRMEDLRRKRTQVNKALKEGLITENQHAKALNRIQVELKGLSGRYREASNAASGLTKEGIRFRDKMAGAMTNALTRLGGVMAATFAVSRVVSFVRTSIDQIANFEQAVSRLQGISRATGDEIQRMTTLARELAAASAFTATQVVDAQTELAKLGQTVPEIEKTTEAVLLLATAAGRSVPQAAEVMQQTLNQFNIDASESERIVNLMAKSFTTSALDLDRWQAAMKNAGVAANAVGATIEDTAAALAVLIDAGIPAEKAGTDLRNIFIALEVEGLSWKEAMDSITGSQKQLTTAVDLFKQRSGPAGVALAANAEKADRLAESYRNLSDDARRLAAVQLDNLKGDRLLLASAWEEFILQVEDGSGVVGDFGRAITQMATAAIQAISLADTNIEKFGNRLKKAEESGWLAGWLQKMILLRDAVVETGVAQQQFANSLQGELQREITARDKLQKQRDKELARYNTTVISLGKIAEANERILEIERQIKAEKDEKWQKHLRDMQGYLEQKSVQGAIADEIKAQGQPILENLNNKLKDLRASRDKATSEREIAQLNKEIAATQAEIDRLLGRVQSKTQTIKQETKQTEENIYGWTTAASEAIQSLDKAMKAIRGRDGVEAGGGRIGKDDGDMFQKAIDEQGKAIADSAKRTEMERLEAFRQTEMQKREIASATIEFFNQLGSGLLRNEQERLNRRLRNEMDFLEKMRQNNEISQEEYERLTLEAQKRQFRQTQRLRTQEATLNLAAAIMTILAQQGLPAGLGAIASATAMGGAQIATIQAAKFAKGGMLKGDSHERGGIPLSVGGKKIVEAEGGEAIINKRSTAMFREQLSAINQAGGGVKFASGGLLSAPRATVGLGTPTGSIDYDKMAAAFANVNIETSVVEITGAQALQNQITQIRRL